MPTGRTRRQTTYQYKTGDDPTRLAQQFGTTPRQLINANPGGYPFSTGQMINLPQQLLQPPTAPPSPQGPLPRAVTNFQYTAPRVTPRFGAPSPQALQQAQLKQQPKPAGVPTGTPTGARFDEIVMPQRAVFEDSMKRLAAGEDISRFSAPEQAALIHLMVQDGLLPPGTTARDLLSQTPQGTQVNTGAAPFGVNQQGQRLDIYGNAWDPNTAQRDIYGGQFKQPGETRYRRNAAGNIIKEVLVSGNKWVRVRQPKQTQAAQPVQAAQPPPLSGTSFGVVNFGVGGG